MFAHQEINLEILKQRAFNLRWASVPAGVIPLTAADPDFPCAPEISEAIKRYASDRYFSYGPPEGHSFFKESVSRFHIEKRNVPARPEWIFPVDSAAAGIFTICQSFLNAGDEAIIFDPIDFLFKYSIEAQKAVSIPLSVDSNPETPLDTEKLESLISPKTRMICVCNPLNPNGKVLTKSELEKIGALAVKHNLIILSDEIWSDIVFTPNTYTSIAALDESIRKQTIVVTGYSKSYGLAGLRVGTIIAFSEPHFKRLLQLSEHLSTIHGCNILGQVAASAALDSCSYWLKSFLVHLEKMRNICVSELNRIPGFHCHAPQGCYLAFPNIAKTGFTAEELQQHLLTNAKVATVPGLPKWFGQGANDHIRISFATSEELIREALGRIANAMIKK
jgi:aminotransferase